MKLNELRDNSGARTVRTRVGRGVGSGLGKTAGRGQKGQKSRSGVAIKGFEGGQMPIHMRTPKRGFNNLFAKDYAVLNLHRLQAAIDAGKVDASLTLTYELLRELGLVSKAVDGLRILGYGAVTSPLTLCVAGISAKARQAIEAAGGSVTLVGAE